jgi:arylsulfatase
VEHDGQVGQLLKKLDGLGIANNTIVIYTTDNGAETFTWPGGGTTPFCSGKNTPIAWRACYRNWQPTATAAHHILLRRREAHAPTL